MNQHIKFIVLFVAALSITSVGFAQQNGRESTESVIVMTKARLDSILTGIANTTRAVLADREQDRFAGPKLKQRALATPAWKKLRRYRPAPSYNMRKPRYPASGNARIFHELNRINRRIDRLMMEMYQGSPQTYRNYSNRPGTIVIPSSPRIYQRRRPFVPNRQRYSGNAGARVQDTLSTDIKRLQDKIEALQARITSLVQNPDSTNKQEISRLKERINALSTQLENADRNITSRNQQQVSGNKPLIAVLKSYHQTIYFANDSAILDSAAKALISQLARMIKRSDRHVTVLVQGYASKTGTALYNFKLSRKRANAVENVLTNYGINAGQIETIGHGVSKSHSAPAARKVEISLLIH